MGWFIKLVFWVAGTAIPCWLVATPYQRWLAETASATLRMIGGRATVGTLHSPFTFALGMFVAMCLAGQRAPARARTRAILLGIPFMISSELFLIIVVAWILGLAERGVLPTSTTQVRLVLYAVETVPWLGAPLTWLALLGGFELRSTDLAKHRCPRGRRVRA